MLRDRRDRDRIREDVGAFARVVGWPLTDWQTRAMRLEARTTCVVAPRQTGKSRSVAVLAAHRAFTSPNSFVLIVSASDDSAIRLLGVVRDLVTGSPLLAGSVIDEQSRVVRLSNGSQIRSTSASERSVRGWTADLLILDECQSIPEAIFDAVQPTTAAREQAKTVLCGTAGVPIGRFYDAVAAGLDHSSRYVRSFMWKLKDAKWISDDAIEAARLLLPPMQFAAEYEGKWASSADSMFPIELLRRQSVAVEVPDLSELAGSGVSIFGGVDWGATTDRTVAFAIARIPIARWNVSIEDDFPIYLGWPLRVFAPGTPLSTCVDEIVACDVPWHSLTVETVGLGQMPAQEVRRRINTRTEAQAAVSENWLDVREARVTPVHTSTDHKAAGYGALRGLLERGQLFLAEDTEMLREFAAVSVELRAHGVSINATGGAHDDIPDSAILAALPYRDRAGHMRVRLADFAGTARRERDPLPGVGRDVDLVTTPGGINVPRAPWLQSIGDDDVRVPPASRPRPKPPPEPTLIERGRIAVQVALNERNS